MYLLLRFPADTKQLDLQADQKIEAGPKISPLCIVTKNVFCSIWGHEILLYWGGAYIQNIYNYINYIDVNPAYV